MFSVIKIKASFELWRLETLFLSSLQEREKSFKEFKMIRDKESSLKQFIQSTLLSAHNRKRLKTSIKYFNSKLKEKVIKRLKIY
jgi:hypothetical protein